MTNRGSIKTPVQSFPKQGNRELPWIYDFTATASINDDLGPEMQTGQIDEIQSIYIDNSANLSPVTFIFNGIYNVTAKPGTQGIYPVIAAGLVKILAQSAGAVKVPVIFSNTAKPFFVWGAA